MFLQVGIVANSFADCNKLDFVGLLQHFSFRALFPSLPGESTANRPKARQIDWLRLKRLILGPTRPRFIEQEVSTASRHSKNKKAPEGTFWVLARPERLIKTGLGLS